MKDTSNELHKSTNCQNLVDETLVHEDREDSSTGANDLDVESTENLIHDHQNSVKSYDEEGILKNTKRIHVHRRSIPKNKVRKEIL